jgi:hypothetical protein
MLHQSEKYISNKSDCSKMIRTNNSIHTLNTKSKDF